jgi:RHS repeat-associated protein
MKVLRTAVLLLGFLAFPSSLVAQTSPNLDNGWKPFGSYDGTHLDTVNLMNGNLMLHLPIVPDVPQRGSLKVSYSLYGSSKDWQVSCSWNQQTQKWQCGWQKGGGSLGLRMTLADLSVHRTLDKQYTGNQGNTTVAAYGYTITTPDGSTHQVHGVSGTEDVNGDPTQFDSTDLSGYHLVVSGSDATYPMIKQHATLTDRNGNQYQGDFNATTGCGRIQFSGLSAPGNHPPMFDDAPAGDQYCSQVAYMTLAADSNGNQISIYHGDANPNPTTDTLNKYPHLSTSLGTSDYSGCVSSHAFNSAVIYYYQDPNGVTQQIKFCRAEISIQTAFHQPNPFDNTVMVGEAVTGIQNVHLSPVVSVVLADGTRWSFDYDNYGLLTYVGLPTGGSISYTWTTINYSTCDVTSYTKFSRAVAARTLNDGQGHTYTWQYNWGTPSTTSVTNTVTDPLGNDTVHVFTSLQPANTPGCNLYETSTIQYQGSAGANHPLQRVDTAYSSTSIAPDDQSFYSTLANVFATDVVTTVYPSGKVKKVHKDPDTGLGIGLPIFGNTKKELVYDWGQGAPGPLLRETDSTYQWEVNSAYRTAGLLDLPASVVIKDSSGNRVAEADYTYDEPSYLTTPTPAITTQHVAPPYGVRGNLSTASRWLNPGNSFVSSHTKWYDTGEPYQKLDPLGHTTTYSYDPFYIGAYVTQTCSPTTNGISHCVSGTYDFNSGFITTLTNESAATQASGNTPGDAAHTSNYAYDNMWRLTSALASPDPTNGGTSAQNIFSFSPANTFPVSAQRSKSVTTSLSDVTTSFFDGLGRGYKGQHTLPNGTATVDTTFDAAGHVATVSNPYFSTSDPTYGLVSNAYDGLDRVTQVNKQDGSISKVQYNVATTIAVNGDCTISTDEAGKQRGACTDALGRLVEVDEPNAGATIIANYHATMQSDGNFVLYNSANASQWSTGTGGSNAGPIMMQDDGNLVLYMFKWQGGVYNPNGAPGPFPAQGCSIGTYLIAGQRLNGNQCVVSPRGQYFLYMGTDGNMFIYDMAQGSGTWGANTYGHPGAYALLQTDGNFVVYDPNGTALWSSGTGGTYSERLDMEDDGRIIIYKSAWNSGTATGQFNWNPLTHPGCDVGTGTGWTGVLGSGQCFVSPNGRFELLLQADGNLVINDLGASPIRTLWSTNTAVSPVDPGFAMRTLYSYDALGNLLRVDQKGTAPNDSTQWRTRTFTYDSLSRLLTASNPESGTISYVYDNDGNLLQKTSPAPNQTGSATQTVSYCYDELHRVTGKGYGAQSCPISSPVVTYTYDSGPNAKGHLTAMTDQAGTASYGYDILGRITTETRTLMGANNASISKTVSYEYNLDGSLKALHYPSGAVITYTPDSAGRVLSAVDGANGINYVTGAAYGADSALTGFISGSGGPAAITNSFSYNKRLQPLTTSASTPSQTVFSIGYDFHAGNGTAGSGADNGNVYGIYNYRDRSRDQSFTYDPLNRLLTAQNAGTNCAATTVNGKTEYWGNSYSYDAWGNLLGKTVTKCSAENLGVTADAHNWIHSSGTDYRYDAAGNMTFDATANLAYNFDQENRLTGAAGYTYTYDGDGNRVIKANGTTASSGTLYWYMTPGVVAESDLAGTLKSEYIFFDGERVARKDFPGNTVAYYFSDHLKTASVITDAAGTIKAESDYYPWGGELQFVNNDSNDYKFTGKKRDTETGLDYFGARYYSNGLGRFMTPDWAAKAAAVPYAEFSDPQTLNLYSYVRNIPTTRFDIDGHQDVPRGRPPAEEEAMNRKEDEEAQRLIERGNEQLETENRNAEAAEIAKGKAAFANEHPDGYDEPNGLCRVGPEGPSIGPAEGTPATPASSTPPTFVETNELQPFSGGKTIGLLGNQGSPGIPIFSGVKGPAEQIPKGTPGFDIVSRTHVEGHTAAVMRLSGINNATLVLNNPVICSSCLKNLPSMLPSGSQLTVVFPNGQTATFYGNSR